VEKKTSGFHLTPEDLNSTNWGFSSVVERLPTMCEELGSIPSTENKRILIMCMYDFNKNKSHFNFFGK
jgi:hypothetical protein